MRRTYLPMLAKTADASFSSPDWLFEIKWDGIRAISYVEDQVSIRSRNNRELKDTFPELQELPSLAHQVVLDGEMVAMRQGKPDFEALLERNQASSTRDVAFLASNSPITYVVFDILEKNGDPLIDLPLTDRKRILAQSLKEGEHVILSSFVEEAGESYFKAALDRGLEGIIAKKKQSKYEPGLRSSSWLKIKQVLSCDCVIFGYTKGQGKRRETFGALILGLYDANEPVYVGKVGTGFSDQESQMLMRKFVKHRGQSEILKNIDVQEEVVWLEPALVCRVDYQNVTKDGRLRMPRYMGLRMDKEPRECTTDQINHKNSLEKYRSKRNFALTEEPKGNGKKPEGKTFVVQEHHARRLHYDMRLEREGTLKSWAVPKGIPIKTGEKRLAVQVEDHPLEYAYFEGSIPEGQYGAGQVKIWDKGFYETKFWDMEKIEVSLNGTKLRGKYAFIRLKKAGPNDWLLLKAKD